MAKPMNIRKFEEGLAARILMQTKAAILDLRKDDFEGAEKVLMRIIQEDLMGEVLEKGFDKKGIEKMIEEERRIILARAAQARNELAKLIKEDKEGAIAEIKKDKARTKELLEIIRVSAAQLFAAEARAIKKREAA